MSELVLGHSAASVMQPDDRQFTMSIYACKEDLYKDKCKHLQEYNDELRADIKNLTDAIQLKASLPYVDIVLSQMRKVRRDAIIEAANEYRDSFDYAYSDDIQHSYKWMMNYANNLGGKG